MARIAFVTNNFTRKPEFQLTTRAIKKPGGIFFRKQALTNEAKAHIIHIRQTYDRLSRFSDDEYRYAKPLAMEPEGSYIDFVYAKGISLEKMLLDATLNNDSSSQLVIIKRYETLLKKLTDPKAPHYHKHYQATFGQNLYGYFGESACVSPGLLDCNFDNLIDNNGSITVIDYEFCFDFCLPYDYLLARALMWFGLRHSELLKMNSKKLDLVAVSDELLFDKNVYEKYKSVIFLIPKVSEIEWLHLQKWINGGDYDNIISFFENSKKYSVKSTFALDRLQQQDTHIVGLNEHIKELTISANSAEAELKAIKGSRAYMAAQKLSRYKSKITPLTSRVPFRKPKP